MTSRRTTKADRAKRRAQVARLYVRGMDHAEIAAKLGWSPTTILNDIAKMEERWIDESTRDLRSWLGFFLDAYRALVREIYTAYAESKEPHTVVEQEYIYRRDERDEQGNLIPIPLSSRTQEVPGSARQDLLEMIPEVLREMQRVLMLDKYIQQGLEGSGEFIGAGQMMALEAGDGADAMQRGADAFAEVLGDPEFLRALAEAAESGERVNQEVIEIEPE